MKNGLSKNANKIGYTINHYNYILLNFNELYMSLSSDLVSIGL